MKCLFFLLVEWRSDTWHNGIQYSDTQHNVTQHRIMLLSFTLCVVILGVAFLIVIQSYIEPSTVVLGVAFFNCYAECHYAACCYAKRHGAI